MGKLDTNITGRRFKGIMFNYDAVREESDDTCLFCLTKQQVAYLLASLEPARWPTRWYSPTDQPIDEDWLDNVFSALEVELMTDHCDLATDITNILTQITNINTNITVLQTQVTNIYNTTNVNVQIINQATITYEQQVIDDGKATGWKIPDTTYGTDSSDVTIPNQYARWWALETCCLRWIKTILYRVIVDNDPTNINLATLYTDLVTAGGVVIGAVLRPSLGGLGYTLSQVVTAALDAAAAETVSCALANALYNYQVTHANLSTALTGVAASFTPGTNAAIIAAVMVAADNADLLTGSQYNYNSFLSILWVTWQKYYITANSWTSPNGCTLSAYPGGAKTWDFKTNLAKEAWLIIRGQMVRDDGYDQGLRAVRRFNTLVYAHDIWLEINYPNVNTVGRQLKITAFYSSDKDGDTANGNDAIFVAFSQDPGTGCPAFGTGSSVNFSPGTANALNTVTVNFPAIGTTCGIRIWGTQNGGNICRRWYIEKIQIL